MVENKYLDEEKYQKGKKKITVVAALILVIGLLIGGILIATGLKKSQEAKLSSEQVNSVQLEIDNYKTQLSSLRAQLNQELENNGLSENYYNIDNQIDKLEDKIDKLEDSLDKDTSYLVIFYIFGGFIIFAALMTSGAVYTIAKGRDINAFFAQQQMPVAKEGIDKMAPTIGNAAGEIAKGIKKGLKDK